MRKNENLTHPDTAEYRQPSRTAGHRITDRFDVETLIALPWND
jgi:hypothetical protein